MEAGKRHGKLAGRQRTGRKRSFDGRVDEVRGKAWKDDRGTGGREAEGRVT